MGSIPEQSSKAPGMPEDLQKSLDCTSVPTEPLAGTWETPRERRPWNITTGTPSPQACKSARQPVPLEVLSPFLRSLHGIMLLCRIPWGDNQFHMETNQIQNRKQNVASLITAKILAVSYLCLPQHCPLGFTFPEDSLNTLQEQRKRSLVKRNISSTTA